MPTGNVLHRVCQAAEITPLQLCIGMGHIDSRLRAAIHENWKSVYDLIADSYTNGLPEPQEFSPCFETKLGELYQADCLELMPTIDDDSFDLIFADPPFNLEKLYPSNIDDKMRETRYLAWCEDWVNELCRLLRPGGSLFIWNLPRWNVHIASYLRSKLTFRHWIAVDIKYSLPIQKRLYPSHYSLLYFVKGERPNEFSPDRLPMEVCPHCARDLKDYGGYKAKMNPAGVNLTDVWNDIPPVRHGKYKKRKGANELSVKLLDRVIEMASKPGDRIFDPFGGSGTTYVVAEIKGRRWIGTELGPLDDIVTRFETIESDRELLEKIRDSYNTLFTTKILQKREARGLWTADSVREIKSNQPSASSKKQSLF